MFGLPTGFFKLLLELVMQWLGKRLAVLTTGQCDLRLPWIGPHVGVLRHPVLGSVAVLFSTLVLAFNLANQDLPPWFLGFYMLLLPVVGSVFVVKGLSHAHFKHSATTLGRYDAVLLVSLCLALLVYDTGNISLQSRGPDGWQNLKLGLTLAREGQYREYPTQVGYHKREPFMPAVIAIVDLTRRALGHAPLPSQCLHFPYPECWPKHAPYKVVQVVFLLLAAVGSFLLVLWFTGVKLLAYTSFFLVAKSSGLLYGHDDFYTEIAAAALMVTTSVLSLLALNKRRWRYSALLGLSLTALVLTKVVFAWLWVFIALAFVVSDLLERRFRRSTALLVSVFLAVHFATVGAYMARNFVTSGDFSLVERRSGQVWSLRVAYNEMRDDEFAAGFWYYLPMISESELVNRGIPRAAFERFLSENEAGFRTTGDRKYLSRLRHDEWESGRREIEREIENDAKAQFLANPWQHLKVSLLLAWRGVFAEYGLGHIHAVRAQRLADRWGFAAWPRWSQGFSGGTSTIVNLTGSLALIAAPLGFWFFRGRFEAMLVTLPALYSHGVYAVASHFLPRFAQPEIPLRVVATMLLLSLLLVPVKQRLGGFITTLALSSAGVVRHPARTRPNRPNARS